MIGKIRTTRKQIQNSFARVFQCGYCDLQYIFQWYNPSFYNSGIYGWNYDVYDLGNIAITTGYRGMFGERIPGELIKHFDAEAQNILSFENKQSYKEKQKAMEALKERFYEALRAL